jgi:hypothetical protein
MECMGGEPPLRREDEEPDDGVQRERGHWLERELGEQWRSEGDGIYRLVGQTDPAEAPVTAPDFVDDLIAQLSGELGDGSASRNAADARPSQPPPAGQRDEGVERPTPA